MSKGFSLLEVLVAVTLIALLAAGALGVLGYHQKAAARVSERFQLYSQAVALCEEVPYILRETEERFPSLKEGEAFRVYEGETAGSTWKARIHPVTMAAVPPFFQMTLTVTTADDTVEVIRYLSP